MDMFEDEISEIENESDEKREYESSSTYKTDESHCYELVLIHG